VNKSTDYPRNGHWVEKAGWITGQVVAAALVVSVCALILAVADRLLVR